MLPETSTAEVSSMAAPFPDKTEPLELKPSPFEEAARKDSAVHVSLSSDSLVKQREPSSQVAFRLHRLLGAPRRHSPASAGAAEVRTSDMAIAHGRMIHRVNSEGLRGRAIALGSGAPKRPYIVFWPRACQRLVSPKLRFVDGTAPTARRPPHHSAALHLPRGIPLKAPYCGHIVPPFLTLVQGTVAMRGRDNFIKV